MSVLIVVGKEATCSLCRTTGPVAEYHPYAFCMMAKAVGRESARANLNAVLDYGRKLERLGMPNDAPIAAVREINPRYLIWSNVHGAWWGPNNAGYYTERTPSRRAPSLVTATPTNAGRQRCRSAKTAHSTPTVGPFPICCYRKTAPNAARSTKPGSRSVQHDALSCSWASAVKAEVCPLILLPTPPSEEGGRPDKKL